MVADLDIDRLAKLLIDGHGDDAATHAAMQADAMLERGDLVGKWARLRIIAAIEELQRTEPAPGERAISSGAVAGRATACAGAP